MLIKPGRKVSVRSMNGSSACLAAVLDVGKGTFSMSLLNGMVLKRGDVVELEVAQWEDALYLLKARVMESGIGGACILKEVGEPFRLQRRQCQRIPTRLCSEYLLLPQRLQDWKFQQGLILDISNGGALLSLVESLEAGRNLWIIFQVLLRRGDALSTGVKGEVLREQRSNGVNGYCYGIKFDRPLGLLTG